MEPRRIQGQILLVARSRTRIVQRFGVDLPDAPSIVNALPVYPSQYVGLRLSDLQLVVVRSRDDEITDNGLSADRLLRLDPAAELPTRSLRDRSYISR